MATNTIATKIPAVAVEMLSNGTMQIAFASGNTIILNPDSLAAHIIKQATRHGLKQKLIDAAAIGRDPNTGRSATNRDKENAVMEIFDRITGDNPTWNKNREGGVTITGGLFVAALMRFSKKSREDVLAYLEKQTKEQKAALRKNTKIVELIEEIRAERDVAKSPNDDTIDSDAMLGDLMRDDAPSAGEFDYDDDGEDEYGNKTNGDDDGENDADDEGVSEKNTTIDID